MTEYPLVSCVMPTANRRDFIPGAVRCFMAQDYPNKELIILRTDYPKHWDRCDVIEGIRDYIWCPEHDLIDDPMPSLGAIRNQVNKLANGKYIAHFDDDDYSAPDRLSMQVRALEYNNADLCGLSQLIFHDLRNGNDWLYRPIGWRTWLAGGSLVYTKKLWESGDFPDEQIGSDYLFLQKHLNARKVVLDDLKLYCAMIHERNTSPKQFVAPNWKRLDMPIPQHIVQRAPVVSH